MSCSSERHGCRGGIVRLLCLFAVLLVGHAKAILAQSPGVKDAGPSVAAGFADDAIDSGTLAVASPALPDDPEAVSQPPEWSSRSGIHALIPTNTTFPHTPQNPEKFQFKSAFIQTFNENLFFQVWRVAFDPGLRYNLWHKPFIHDWGASYCCYDMSRWSDGDNFIVNDVGHPMEGGVFARSFLINSPRSQVAIGKNSRYWTSRLKAMAWAAAWSTQLEIGPISETDIGNQGGFTYVPGCGTSLSCLNNPKYHKPSTNNTGWTDFVVTPTVGLLWVLGEDTIDKYIVTPIAVNHRILGGRVLRSALEPTRSFAAIFAGKFPWELPSAETNFAPNPKSHFPNVDFNEGRPRIDHWEMGTQYSNISLPVLSNECGSATVACRKNLSGLGLNFDYNFTRDVAFDSTLNFIPGQQGSKPMMVGLFGVKIGPRFQHWGVFGKVRPGFIYYQNAMPGGGDYTPNRLTRFAWDVGGIVEVYTARNSTLRFDVGTTLVRYLDNHPDTVQYPLGSVLSTQYIVTQGNFQVATSYTYRF